MAADPSFFVLNLPAEATTTFIPTPFPSGGNFRLLEDGVSFRLLEDGTSKRLLE